MHPVPKLLVVEDHTDSLTVLARILTGYGYSVTPANGYQAAIEAAKKQRHDLLIADISLWDGDGCHLLAELRNLPQHSTLKGIAVTALGMPSDIQQCLDAGYTMHVLKPYDRIEIIMAVVDVLAASNVVFRPDQHGTQLPVK